MRRAVPLLLALGLLQMTGDLLRVPLLKGLGAATGASPAPKVFSAVRGLETYSTRFFLEWTGADGRAHRLRLTSEVYANLRGPYNRRNVYGAVLAYGPVLATDERTRPMYEAVLRRALCGDAPLLHELGAPQESIAADDLRVVLEPLADTAPNDLPRVLDVPCR